MADCRSAAFVLWGFDSLSAHQIHHDDGPEWLVVAVSADH